MKTTDWVNKVRIWNQALLDTPRILESFRNKYYGKRCVIIGNGPSLNQMDWSLFKNEYTFGLNRIYLLFDKMGFTPSFYTCVNPLVIEQSIDEICKIDAQKFLPAKQIKHVEQPEGIAFLRSIYKPNFFTDVTKGVYEGYTVTFVAMQLAYYMGFSQVVLVGVDHSYKFEGAPNQETVSEGSDPNHFHPDYFGKGFRWHLPDLDNSEKSYRLAKGVFEQDGRVIVDATLGGKLTIFPKVDYRDIFANDRRIAAAVNGPKPEAVPAPQSASPNGSESLAQAPLVSAIVSTYNAERYIAGCLDDLENQTIADRLEIVVVNSGSRQNEEAIVRRYQTQYKNITYIRTEARETVYQAWNRGIRAAKGKYITNANTDDRHMPDAFEKMAAALEAQPEVALVYANQHYYEEVEGEWVFRFVRERGPFSAQRLYEDCYMGSQPMWRKSVHERVGYFDEAFFTAGDYEFWLRLGQEHTFFNVDEFLGKRLLRPDSLEYDSGAVLSHFETAVLLKCYHYARMHNLPVDERGLSQHPIFSKWCELNLLKRSTRNKVKGGQPLLKEEVSYIRDWRNAKRKPELSIVIATYNREEDLLVNLRELGAQSGKKFEVIVVNNGPEQPGFEKLPAWIDYDLCYVQIKANYGPSLARNVGALLARAEIVAFLDDDAAADSNWVANILKHFKDEKVIALRGRVIPKHPQEIMHLPPNYDLGDELLFTTTGIEMNSAFRRAEFIEVGGFDENLFGFEGAELSYRLWQKHDQRLECIQYFPDVIISHDFSTSPEHLYEVQLRNKAMKRVINKKWPGFEQYLAFHWNTLPQNRRLDEYAWCLSMAEYCSTFSPEAALDYAMQASEVEPFNFRAYLIMASAYFRLGEPDTGLVMLDTSFGLVEYLSQNSENLGSEGKESVSAAFLSTGFTLAQSYLSAGRQEQARQVLNRMAQNQHILWDQDARQKIDQLMQLAGQEPVEDRTLELPARLQNVGGTDGGWKPKISAIISTYNAARFLRGCLDDLYAQTLADQLEIIVVNSGSKQNEKSIVAEYQKKHPNIVYLETAECEPVYKAWNRALQVARGEYVTNANTDDRHHPRAFEILVGVLDARPDVGVVYADSVLTNTINTSLQKGPFVGRFRWPDFNRRLLFRACLVGPQPVWRKSLHNQFGLFDETMTSAGDYEFWLRISDQVRFYHLPQVLGLYYEGLSSIEHRDPQRSILEAEQARQRHWKPEDGIRPQPGLSFLERYSPAPEDHLKAQFPLISVIVPTYNRPTELKKALASIADQTYPNLEVLVINDHGTEVGPLLKSFEKRLAIRYESHPKNRGAGAARNTGLKLAQGKYIAFLDDDDTYRPEHLMVLFAELEANPQLVAAYSDGLETTMGGTGAKPKVLAQQVTYSFDFSKDELMVHNYIPNLCLMVRSRAVEQAGIFDEKMSALEDWEWLTRLAILGDFKHLPLVTCDYLSRAGSDSRNMLTPAQTRDLYQMIYTRLSPVASPAVKQAQGEFYRLKTGRDLRKDCPDLFAPTPEQAQPVPDPAEALFERLVEAEDIAGAIQQHLDQFDQALVDVIRRKALVAHSQQETELAEGLGHLAAIIAQVVTERSSLAAEPPQPEQKPESQALQTFELLMEADDLMAALDQYADRLDAELVTVIRLNAQQASEAGDLELAEGLQDLETYILQLLAEKA